MFGAGKLPKAPGTWGTIASMPVIFIPEAFRFDIILSLILVFTLISLPMIKQKEKEFGQDPSWIVVDEAIGIWIVLLDPLLYSNWSFILYGFLLFRIFDIFKPYPISLLNEKSGEWYVILDDVVAAILSLICFRITLIIINNL